MKNNVVKVLALICFIAGLLIACNTNLPAPSKITMPIAPTTTASMPIIKAGVETDNVRGSLTRAAEKILGDANVIKTATTNPVVTTRAESIIVQTGVIRDDAMKLDDVKLLLSQALDATNQQAKYTDGLVKVNAQLADQIISNEKSLADLHKQNEELKTKAHLFVNTILGLLIVASVVGIGFSVYSGITGTNPKQSIGIGAGSTIVAIVAATVISQWDKLAWLGLAGVVIVVGLLVWQAIVLVRGMHVKVVTTTKALDQVVTTVEAAKVASPVATNFSGVANVIQDQKTQALVAAIKNT